MNDDDLGISLMLINTEKGREIFEAIKDKLEYKEVDPQNCLQPNLCHPSAIHPKRMDFEKDYSAHGFEYVMKKYGNIGWRYYAKKIIEKIISEVKQIYK